MNYISVKGVIKEKVNHILLFPIRSLRTTLKCKILTIPGPLLVLCPSTPLLALLLSASPSCCLNTLGPGPRKDCCNSCSLCVAHLSPESHFLLLFASLLKYQPPRYGVHIPVTLITSFCLLFFRALTTNCNFLG